MIYFDTMDYVYCIPAQFYIQWISVLFAAVKGMVHYTFKRKLNEEIYCSG